MNDWDNEMRNRQNRHLRKVKFEVAVILAIVLLIVFLAGGSK